jgi:hypothetical protein
VEERVNLGVVASSETLETRFEPTERDGLEPPETKQYLIPDEHAVTLRVVARAGGGRVHLRAGPLGPLKNPEILSGF